MSSIYTLVITWLITFGPWVAKLGMAFSCYSCLTSLITEVFAPTELPLTGFSVVDSVMDEVRYFQFYRTCASDNMQLSKDDYNVCRLCNHEVLISVEICVPPLLPSTGRLKHAGQTHKGSRALVNRDQQDSEGSNTLPPALSHTNRQEWPSYQTYAVTILSFVAHLIIKMILFWLSVKKYSYQLYWWYKHTAFK